MKQAIGSFSHRNKFIKHRTTAIGQLTFQRIPQVCWRPQEEGKSLHTAFPLTAFPLIESLPKVYKWVYKCAPRSASESYGILKAMLALALVVLFSFAQQGDDEVIISSKSPQEREGNVAHFKDEVVATYRDMRFEGDFADYDQSTRQLTAGEHVRF